MTDLFANLIIISILAMPILLVTLIIKAIRKKPIKRVVIAIAICAGSIIPLTILGVITDPATPQRFEEALVSLKSDTTSIPSDDIDNTIDIEIESVEEVEEVEEVETQKPSEGIVETSITPNYTQEANKESPRECEPGKKFSFQSQGSTAMSYVRPYCEHPGHVYITSSFRGTPNDLSYLDAIRAHSDSDEIVWGEYYTITATVVHADYDIMRTRLRCKVESENIIVVFSVDFRGEFEELVDSLQEGDTVIFRGRFYDNGCGFTDCELIIE